MRFALLATLVALLLVNVDAHSSHNPHTRKVLGNGVANSNVVASRNTNGRFFDFSTVKGGAKGFLEDLQLRDPAKFHRILSNSGWRGTYMELANQLQQEEDLVRPITVQHCTS